MRMYGEAKRGYIYGPTIGFISPMVFKKSKVILKIFILSLIYINIYLDKFQIIFIIL